MTEAQARKFRRGGYIYRLVWIGCGLYVGFLLGKVAHVSGLSLMASTVVCGVAFRYLGHYLAWLMMRWLKRRAVAELGL